MRNCITGSNYLQNLARLENIGFVEFLCDLSKNGVRLEFCVARYHVGQHDAPKSASCHHLRCPPHNEFRFEVRCRVQVEPLKARGWPHHAFDIIKKKRTYMIRVLIPDYCLVNDINVFTGI